uniref:Lipoxygenase n=1 Tax=Davidia involucrata TaxID=16924 RepID=A0A5B6ZC88_DAVIN
MLKTPPVHQSQSAQTLVPWHKPFVSGTGNPLLPFRPGPVYRRKHENARVRYVPSSIKAISIFESEKATSVKAVVTVKQSVGGIFSKLGLTQGLDDLTDLFGKSLLLELVCAELDPETGAEKKPIKGYVHLAGKDENEAKYEASFKVPDAFGEIGAVLVENEHHKEIYLENIVLDGFFNGPVNVTCNSWVHSKYDNPQKRVFFTNKSYLPSETPSGLKRLREEELINLQGDGQGERKTSDRIYDYDVYNDLGVPDDSDELARPVLGGQEHPYPRRCRTGRPRTKTDPSSETRSGITFYVPRDETFSEVKELTFAGNTLYSVLHAVVPSLETAIVDKELGFPYFTAIDSLYNEGVNVPALTKNGFLRDLLPRIVKFINDAEQDLLRFETPELIDRDKFSWFRDEEFSRQTLAGLNPYGIELVTEWPLTSKLDPEIYGPPESAITKELIEQEIKGFMTIEEALKQKKLFILDYHDLLLPYVSKVRDLKLTTLYGSRTLFFLTPEGTLRPLAIELTRPPANGKPQWKQVFTPAAWNATGCWLWKLAKAHVLAHDSGIHQLVSHWLRTHCCVEPYIIASNRQLSAMHPIYRLLHPHFRYTMEINALARQKLINADGIIEASFSPGKYSIELSSVAYDQLWRFDKEALPADLINRGLAVEDSSAPHGLKLMIEDYPFANDGLLLWDAIKQWVTDYVDNYYSSPSSVQDDQELQAWWTEIRTVGHGDKKDEPWWPKLETPQDLIGILNTIIWVTSGHHAAVNFGQYTFAGYFPNRPTIVRQNMPTEDPSEEKWKFFMEKPEATMLMSFPSQIQATKVMAVLDVLSSHSPDEEYIGEVIEPSWAANPNIQAAFQRFKGELKKLEGVIDLRNQDANLKNRTGAGVVPYELLKPVSEPGVTGKGVPYSISI